jgi:hypothetical protein
VGNVRRFAVVLAVLVLAAVAAVAAVVLPRLASAPSQPATDGVAPVQGDPRGPVTPASTHFSYGFDFSVEGPYANSGSPAQAVSSARRVMSSIPGMLEDTAIMDWGLPNPEPSPGVFNLSALAARIRLIRSTGGTPVITLCAAPDWMKASPGPNVPPTPSHYEAFALLAAQIARSFPQVKYFVVWNEFKGFWNPPTHRYEIALYTEMYNDVYTAIKEVRPDALVGGPYAPTQPYATPQPGNLASTPHGAWGYLDQRVLYAIDYWLANKVGADFIAVDGPDYPATGPITDPLTATNKYTAVDLWLRQRTSLPIWWMESHLQPSSSGWSASRAAAIRIATLTQLASSGARSGMQWQPQQAEGWPDQGLWTATSSPGGGQPTALARLLPRVLAVLRYPTTVASGQRPGILVAHSLGGTLAINTTAAKATAVINGTVTSLRPGQVNVTLSHLAQGQG